MERTVDRRAQILEATCRVIAKTGAHDLRIEDVAQEASVSTALIYYYFDTRAELIDRAFEFADARSTTFTVNRLDPRADARRQLEVIMSLELADTEEVRANWAVWSQMEASALFDEGLLRSVRRTSNHWIKIVVDLITRGQQDGSIAHNVDADEAAQRLTAMVDGLGTEWMLGIITQDRARQLVGEAIELELGSRRTQAAGAG